MMLLDESVGMDLQILIAAEYQILTAVEIVSPVLRRETSHKT